MPIEVQPAVLPHLVVDDAAAAIDFYVKAFDAVEHGRVPGPAGKLIHASLGINGSSVMMSDCYPEHGHPYVAPAGFNLMLPVADVDAWWQRAVDAGCDGTMAPQDMFWGDRYAQCKDPFGVTWAFVGPKKG